MVTFLSAHSKPPTFLTPLTPSLMLLAFSISYPFTFQTFKVLFKFSHSLSISILTYMSLFTSICSFAFRLSPRSLYLTRASQINLCLFKRSHSILLLLLISSVAYTPKGQCVCLRGTRGVALLLFQFCSPIQP